jgi:CBS domain-containing protein
MRPILVKELMSYDAISIESYYTVRQTARMMINFRIDAIVVIEDDEIIGTVTIRDLLDQTLDGEDTSKMSIGDILKDTLYFVRPNTTIKDALLIMNEQGTKILPVVSDALDGLLYYVDIVEQRPDLLSDKRVYLEPIREYVI